MKKGFTLIELLAVIVILAIIAVIAVPIVVNIIKDSKEAAIHRSAEFYIDGVENAIATSILHNKQIKDGTYYIMKDGNICLGEYDKEKDTCTGDRLEIKIKGEKPTSGTITIKDGKIDKVILNISNKEIIMNQNGELDYYLAPGLYDKNNKLLASWEELVNDYGLDLENTTSSKNATNVINKFDSASKLVIDESVTSIGSYAFYNCTSLTSITIPNSVTSIRNSAFSGCTGLTSITIPSSVTSIGNSAFSGCTGLTSIKVDENNSVYDSRDNSNAIIETAANTLIAGCKNTKIPNSVTSIGSYAFYNCKSLTSITIPNSVTSIGSSAFSGCTGLTSITIPNSVTSIEYSAFYNCKSLTSITIPNSVTSIGTSAFYNCTSLTSITIPNSVTSIEYSAFYNCKSLTSITIPNSVTSIEDRAFSGCTGLTSITIPNSVTTIGAYAFFGCTGLTSITIPSSVTSIGDNRGDFDYIMGAAPAYVAFSGCTNLTTIYYNGTASGRPWGAPSTTQIIKDF